MAGGKSRHFAEIVRVECGEGGHEDRKLRGEVGSNEELREESIQLTPIEKRGAFGELEKTEPAEVGEMITENASVLLPELRRKEIFRLLVVAQDYSMSVEEAREMACALFGLVENNVVRIEQEGLENDWPPL